MSEWTRWVCDCSPMATKGAVSAGRAGLQKFRTGCQIGNAVAFRGIAWTVFESRASPRQSWRVLKHDCGAEYCKMSPNRRPCQKCRANKYSVIELQAHMTLGLLQ